MTDIKPSHYIVAIVLFIFAIMGVAGLMSEFGNDDPNFIDDEQFYTFNSTFNKYDELNDEVDILENRLDPEKGEEGTFGVLNSLIKVGWNTLTTLLTSFNFMVGVFTGMSTVFGVPVWIPSLLLSLITVLILFAIFGAIFQKDV